MTATAGSTDAERAAALAVLKNFAVQQAWTSRFSMKVVTEFLLVGPAYIPPQHQVANFLIRRRGEVLGISGDYKFLDVGKPYRFQAIFGEEIGTYYQAGLSKPPTNGSIIKNPRTEFALHYFSSTYGSVLDGYVTAAGDRRINEVMAEADDLKIVGTEKVADASCDIVAATTKFGAVRVWFDKDHNYVIRKLAISRTKDDLVDNDKKLSELPHLQIHDGQTIDAWTGVVSDVEVGQVEGTYLPTRGKLIETLEMSEGRNIVYEMTYSRSDIQLNPDFDAMKAFVVDMPDGTDVSYLDDPDAGIGFVWRNGKVVAAGEDFTGEATQTSASPRRFRGLFVGLNIVAIVVLGLLWFRKVRR